MTSVLHGQVLGQDGNTTFSFLIFTVHNTFSGFFLLGCVAKDTRVSNKGINT
jgi:hypothetical protein